MKRTKALQDINRSARSIEAPGTTVSGFAERLVRQYGPGAVVWAVDRSQLTPLQAGWVKRWIQDTRGEKAVHSLKYSKGWKFPSLYHAHVPGSLGSLCGKIPTEDKALLDAIPEGAELCGSCRMRLDSLTRKERKLI